MKVYCDECKKEVEAKSLEETKQEEAPDFNALDPHVHCPDCGALISINKKIK